MAEIILLRHGQASFGADNYDRLSAVGCQQSLWVGEHLRLLGKRCDRLVRGTMERHRETAEHAQQGLQSALEPELLPGLNEYDLRGLIRSFETHFSVEYLATGEPHRDYARNMKRALARWIDGGLLTDGTESWAEFRERVQAALTSIVSGGGECVLVVTSGGPIGTMLALALGLDMGPTRDLIMQSRNTSLTTLRANRSGMVLDCFNDVAHLQRPDRLDHITFF